MDDLALKFIESSSEWSELGPPTRKELVFGHNTNGSDLDNEWAINNLLGVPWHEVPLELLSTVDSPLEDLALPGRLYYYMAYFYHIVVKKESPSILADHCDQIKEDFSFASKEQRRVLVKCIPYLIRHLQMRIDEWEEKGQSWQDEPTAMSSYKVGVALEAWLAENSSSD